MKYTQKEDDEVGIYKKRKKMKEGKRAEEEGERRKEAKIWLHWERNFYGSKEKKSFMSLR